MCLEENVAMLVDASLVEMEFFKVAGFIDDVVEEMKSETAQATEGEWVQDGNLCRPEGASLSAECEETSFCALREEVVLHCGKEVAYVHGEKGENGS